MNITCKINDNYIFDLLKWTPQNFYEEGILELETADLITVKEILSKIDKIDFFYNDNLVGTYNKYDTYESIEFLSKNYDSNRGKFVDILRVKLSQKNLIDKVEELDKVINNIVDIDDMTLEEYQEYITTIFDEKGQKEIFDGCEVLLSDGSTAWFTYNFQDQLNLLSALSTVMLVQDLTTLIPYHSRFNPCKMFTAADIVKIYMSLQAHSILIQTRVNMLNNWIRSLSNKDEALNISYDSELPSPYKEMYDQVIEDSGDLMFTIIEKFFPEEIEENEIEN